MSHCRFVASDASTVKQKPFIVVEKQNKTSQKNKRIKAQNKLNRKKRIVKTTMSIWVTGYNFRVH